MGGQAGVPVRLSPSVLISVLLTLHELELFEKKPQLRKCFCQTGLQAKLCECFLF